MARQTEMDLPQKKKMEENKANYRCSLLAFVNSRFIVSTGGRQFDDFGRVDELQKHDENYFDLNMQLGIQLYLNLNAKTKCINAKPCI